MARTKKIEISESIADLSVLLAQNAESRIELALRILIEIKQSPETTFDELANKYDVSSRTIYRWLNEYKKGGLEGICKLRVHHQKDATMKQMTRSLSHGKFDPSIQENIPDYMPDFKDKLTGRLTRFLNALPYSSDTVEWCKKLRTELCRLFPDIDHVVFRVRTTVDIVRPESNRENGVFYNEQIETGSARSRIKVSSKRSTLMNWQEVFQQGIDAGFDTESYHDPVGFDFYFENADSFLAAMVLFSRKNHPKVSDETIEAIEMLRPFFVFLFSDHIARQRLVRSSGVLFRDMFQNLETDEKLSQREKEVVALLILAHSHEEIATQLNISVKTVESHVKSIYRKIGTKNRQELIAKYNTPRTDL